MKRLETDFDFHFLEKMNLNNLSHGLNSFLCFSKQIVLLHKALFFLEGGKSEIFPG